MAGEISINDKDVLNYTSGFFQIIYNEMEEVIREKSKNLTPEMINFMNKMKIHSKGCFPYFDVAEYIKTSDSLQELLSILEETINRLKGAVLETAIASLWDFYKELMIYGDELMAQGK